MINSLPEIEIVMNREKQAKLICAELNNFIDLKHTLITILENLQNISNCDSVSIRLKENNDYPYYVYKGFTEGFIKHENSICKEYTEDDYIYDNELECMCGIVISGKTLPEYDCFTKSGSFWTNNCEDTINGFKNLNLDIKTRNFCFTSGYFSIALIPIISAGKTIGLIQLNDRQKNKFTVDMIEFIEMIGNQVGMAVNNSMVYEQLKNEKDQLSLIVDELDRTQNQLIESEKMASLGRIVAGVAHEINTPLGIGITATTAFIKDTETLSDLFDKGSLKKSDLNKFIDNTKETGELILRNLQRTANLIKNFKNTSVDQVTEQKREFDLKDYIEKVIENLKPNLKSKKIKFNIQAKEKIQINSYPGVFNQIFTNLILNSFKHGFTNSDNGVIEIQLESDCGILDIKYHDNGFGITEENITKIFEPFFTTNHTEGTGLGLHIIYNLVTQTLKGTIECLPSEKRGATFKIEIPLL